MAHLTSQVIYTQHIFATKQAGQSPYTQDRYPHQGRFGCPTQLYQSQASQNLDEARQGQFGNLSQNGLEVFLGNLNVNVTNNYYSYHGNCRPANNNYNS